MDTNEQENKMIKNWETFYGLINNKSSEEFSEPLKKLCENLQEKLITSPASTKTDYIGAFPGGLIWHSLNVLKLMKELNKTYEANLSVDDMIVTALFHDLGKIGSEDEDYYLSAKSEWHQKNGMPFQLNQSLKTIPVPTLSLWWLKQYQVPLSLKQTVAIQSSNNLFQNIAYQQYDVDLLTMILQQAIWAANVTNKGVEKL